MKQAIFIILTGLLASCGGSFTIDPFEYYPDVEREVPNFTTVEAYETWIKLSIDYISDREAWGVNEKFQTPSLTIDRMSGDCEDMALLLMYIIKSRFGGEPRMWLTSDHAAVVYENNLYLDAGGYFRTTASYDWAIRKAIWHSGN